MLEFILRNIIVQASWRLLALSVLLLVIIAVFRNRSGALRVCLTLFLALYAAFYLLPYLKMYKKAPSNYTHYYLGAKYAIDYKDFYIVTKASLGGPMTGFTNLSGTFTAEENDYYFTKEAEQEYCIGLLKASDVPFNRKETFEELRTKCKDLGLYKKDADRILREKGFDEPTSIAMGTDTIHSYFDFGDRGFNGSPLYVLLRNFDPALYYTPSIRSFQWWIILELAMLCAAIVLLAKTFSWDINRSLIFACLTLITEDFSIWIFQGSVCMTWFLPSILAMYLLKKENYLLAGAAAAVATLIKIFPIIIIAAFSTKVVYDYIKTRNSGNLKKESVFFASFLVFSILLVLVSMSTGVSWLSWIEKITNQMLQGGLVSNNFSIFKTWSIITDTQSRTASSFTLSLWFLRLLFMAFLFALILRKEKTVAITYGAAAGLIFMPWISVDFFNYYTTAHALALVAFFGRRNILFFISLILLIITNNSFFDFLRFADPSLPSLTLIQNLYYPLIPILFATHLLLPEKSPTPARAPAELQT